MLHKYERYLSKHIPQNALALIQKRESLPLLDYKGEPSYGMYIR